jgi:prepilin-type N-terminal cleavage/methylation domain-containing protein
MEDLYMTVYKRGFSLIELLVVVAIICLLVAFLFPVITGARGNALRVVCASNLRQVALICQAYAGDCRGHLPQANSDNPGTFKFNIGTVVDRFMGDLSIGPQVWYCPALHQPKRSPASWMKHIPSFDWNSPDEFPLGYFYVGNPSVWSMAKFVKPVPVTVTNIDRRVELVFDFCSALRPAPNEGRLVKEWYVFPHQGEARPDCSNILMGDMSLESRPKEQLTLGYMFYHPENIYW